MPVDLLGDSAADAGPVFSRACTLGIRPEHLLIGRLTAPLGLGMHASFALRISDTRPFFISGMRAGSHLTVRASGDIRGGVASGDLLSLALRPDRLHAFDGTTGGRLQ